MSMKMPKRFDFRAIEEKWLKKWEEWGVYRFDREDRDKPTYCINTPPPYPSGEFHVGNALNHSYIDFVARYKRMRGYNVLFPQGWDCHGLPTEVRVERAIGKSKSEVPKEYFYKLCVEFTKNWIKPMKEAIRRLGCSIDWTSEYETMNPDYWRRTQLSFIEMYRKGLAYRGVHPVHWCPRCETALAEAEVEYRAERRHLVYFKFKLEEGGEITVASTRPELLVSCVSLLVHPEDNRYKNLIGKKAIVPLYNRVIPIIGDRDVDPEFGTGVVMVCTYGDKTDVRWQKKHGLPIIKGVDEKGRMTDNALEDLRGLTIVEAREKTILKLREEGLYVKEEGIVSNIGTCWRCHTPVEIIPKEQWFVKTIELREEIRKAADQIKWVPEYAKKRLLDWVESVDWDWPISRQRIFATPFPVWYCKNGHIIVADPSWLPIDPRRDKPPIDKCPQCGGEIYPETDVMDTWMDSSITAAVHAGWPDNVDERLFPADLQPNGYDIIRSWDYYLIVRGVALFGKPQFKVALINGMVRGTDGRMMHKSYGNYVSLTEVLDKYGADAFRLWAATSAATGQDVRFNWQLVDYCWRFLVKVWNAARLISIALEDYTPSKSVKVELRDVDHWILSLLDETIEAITDAFEKFDFQRAGSTIIDFFWHKLCDHYLEAVKYRIAGKDGEYREGAQFTLYHVLLNTLRMLSVFAPFITEEIYHILYSKHEPWKSITIAEWPEPMRIANKDRAKAGELIIDVIASIRRVKHDMKIALSAPISSVTIYAGPLKEIVERGLEDIKGTLRIKELIVEDEGRGEHEVVDHPEITFSILP